MSPAYPAFSCPLSPRPPSPAGKGETQSLFRRGLRPRHPCTEPLAALTDPAIQVHGGTTRREPIPVGFAANHGFSPRGCKGRSPLHKKTKNLPLPAGKGGGGMGATKQAKGGVGRANQHRPKERTPCQNRRESPIQYSVTLIRQPFPLRPCGIRSACRLPHGRCAPGKHQSRASRIHQAAGSRQCRKPAPRWD